MKPGEITGASGDYYIFRVLTEAELCLGPELGSIADLK